ncbi:MAG: NAD-dependent epimerase/dehydratase family protein [Deltaproteobacteria bacterium]
MRFVVSGGLGFAGTHLCRQIEAEGHEAIALDLTGEAALACDIRDPDAVEKAIGSVRPDGIFHLAGIAFVPTAGADPGLARAVNVDGTRHILDASKLLLKKEITQLIM